ncbi:ComEC/Rec2 family competence protein [Chitinophaga costaii]|uniref:ComEC/Rec2 family competence protein n=1 Tax=Chitinophaga costaii TaxID=1335309 RepID=UPI000F51501F|nr:ComEC/Rec2 family competence protein [Chitinophaga costaii]
MFVATFFKKAPFVRLLLPWILGLIWQWYWPETPVFSGVAVVVICAALFAFTYLPIARQYFLSPVQGLLLFALVMQCASWVAWQKDVRHDDRWYGRQLSDTCQFVCTIDAPLQQKPYGYKTTACVLGMVHNGALRPAMGELLIYLKPNINLHSGDRILSEALMQPIRNSGNPGAFDYESYLAGQNIFHQVWLTPARTQVLPGGHLPWYQEILDRCRQYCVHTFQAYIPSPREAGLAEALLIGYKDDLDKLLVQDYTQAGVVHIIAISGMHLLLLYEALLWLWQALPQRRLSKPIKAVTILLVLWGFALLAGGSASVLRATVMYTFITLERLSIHRYTNRYNLLAASAFVLLCYQPRFLLDVGFQLSYGAVLSLMLFQRPMAGLWRVKGRAARFCWNMITTTLAAQILTVPVSLYYFHQFPNLFLIANLLAVTLSELAMYGCIALLALGWIMPLARVVGQCLYGLLFTMNTWVNFISRQPYAVTNGLYISGWEMGLLYMALLALAAWLLLAYRQAFRWSLCFVGAAALLHLYNVLHARSQRTLLVYNINHHTAIDVVQGVQVTFAGDPEVLNNTALLQQHLLPARLPRYIARQYILPGAQCLAFASHRLVIVQDKLPTASPIKKFKTDYILLSHNPDVDISQLLQSFDTQLFIFDASCSSGKIKQWKNDCEALTLRCFSVPEQGAFVVNF